MIRMRNINKPMRRILTLVLIAAFGARTSLPARGQSPVKLQNWQGTVDYAPDGVTTFTLSGTSSHLGEFQAYGEIDLAPTDDVFFQAEDGIRDLTVTGVQTCALPI